MPRVSRKRHPPGHGREPARPSSLPHTAEDPIRGRTARSLLRMGSLLGAEYAKGTPLTPSEAASIRALGDDLHKAAGESGH